jgi:D-3-phosphoglycerate dehydrogenase
VAVQPGPDELRRVLAEAEAVILRSGVRLDRAALEAAPRLRLIVRAGVGLDQIDAACAEQRAIRIVMVPHSADGVAEHTIALLLAVRRKVVWLHRRLQEGRWEKQAGVGGELGGHCLGLLGFGRIGRRTAELARAFRMSVLAHDRSPEKQDKQEAALRLGVFFVSLEELFSQSDAVVIQAPLNEATRGLVDARLLGLMRPDAVLVNVGRGGIVDEEALYEALIQGRLGGAALDVFAVEPPGDNPLLRLDNFVGTPHVAAQTVEAQRSIGAAVVRAVEAFAKGDDQ